MLSPDPHVRPTMKYIEAWLKNLRRHLVVAQVNARQVPSAETTARQVSPDFKARDGRLADAVPSLHFTPVRASDCSGFGGGGSPSPIHMAFELAGGGEASEARAPGGCPAFEQRYFDRRREFRPLPLPAPSPPLEEDYRKEPSTRQRLFPRQKVRYAEKVQFMGERPAKAHVPLVKRGGRTWPMTASAQKATDDSVNAVRFSRYSSRLSQEGCSFGLVAEQSEAHSAYQTLRYERVIEVVDTTGYHLSMPRKDYVVASSSNRAFKGGCRDCDIATRIAKQYIAAREAAICVPWPAGGLAEVPTSSPVRDGASSACRSPLLEIANNMSRMGTTNQRGEGAFRQQVFLAEESARNAGAPMPAWLGAPPSYRPQRNNFAGRNSLMRTQKTDEAWGAVHNSAYRDIQDVGPFFEGGRSTIYGSGPPPGVWYGQSGMLPSISKVPLLQPQGACRRYACYPDCSQRGRPLPHLRAKKKRKVFTRHSGRPEYSWASTKYANKVLAPCSRREDHFSIAGGHVRSGACEGWR